MYRISCVGLGLASLLIAFASASLKAQETTDRTEQIQREINELADGPEKLDRLARYAEDLELAPEFRMLLADELLARAADPANRAKALIAKSNAYTQRLDDGDYEKALEYIKEAWTFANRTADPKLAFRVHYGTARIYYIGGELEEAEVHLSHAHRVAKHMDGEFPDIGKVYILIASIYELRGNFVVAAENYEKAFEAGKQFKQPKSCWIAALNYASMLLDQGIVKQAQKWYERIDEERKQVDDPGLALGTILLGWNLQLERGEKLSPAAMRAKLKQYEGSGFGELLGSGIALVAEAQRREGAYEDALETFREAMNELVDSPRASIEAHLGLVGTLIDAQRFDEAEDELDGIDEDELVDSGRLLDIAEYRTRIAFSRSKPELATEAFNKFLKAVDQSREIEAEQRAGIQNHRLSEGLDEEASATENASGRNSPEQKADKKSQSENVESRARWTRNIVMGITGLALLFTLIFAYGHALERKQEALHSSERVMNEELQRLLAKQTETLRQEMDAKQRLENAIQVQQRHEAIGKLTGGVAHDFNNLLTAVLNTNNYMRTHSAYPLASRELELLEASDQAARSGAEIVKALLTYARQQALKETSVELWDFLNSQRSLFRSVLGDGIIYGERFNLEENATIWVDRAQLTTAILNLLSNARDATRGAGHVTLEITALSLDGRSDRPWADLPAGSYARIDIRDDGCGMTKEDQRRAFEPFYTTKSQEEGTGLGLSVVRNFVLKGHGDITIESPGPMCGTTVSIVLPLCSQQPTVPDAPQKVSKVTGQKVLVVDDNEMVRRSTIQLLKIKGFEVQSASNAEEAMQKLGKDDPPSVVLSDVRMPGRYDGVELAKWINANHPSVRVVLSSGYSVDLVEDGFKLLAKPYTVEDLVSVCLNER